jgi:hypothetical protein
VMVPNVFWEATSSRVLTSQWVECIKLSDAAALREQGWTCWRWWTCGHPVQPVAAAGARLLLCEDGSECRLRRIGRSVHSSGTVSSQVVAISSFGGDPSMP